MSGRLDGPGGHRHRRGDRDRARLRREAPERGCTCPVHGHPRPTAAVRRWRSCGSRPDFGSRSSPGTCANRSHCAAAAAEATGRWGQIDILVGNAGLQSSGTLLDSSVARTGRPRSRSTCWAWPASTQATVLPAMLQRGRGAIVAVSSVNALTGHPGQAAYDAAKAGVVALVRHIAVEYGRRGIRANAVCPGATVTEFHLKRAAQQGLDGAALRERMHSWLRAAGAGRENQRRSPMSSPSSQVRRPPSSPARRSPSMADSTAKGAG